MGRDRQMEKGIMLVRRGKKMGGERRYRDGKRKSRKRYGKEGGEGGGRKGVLCKRTIKS